MIGWDLWCKGVRGQGVSCCCGDAADRIVRTLPAVVLNRLSSWYVQVLVIVARLALAASRIIVSLMLSHTTRGINNRGN